MALQLFAIYISLSIPYLSPNIWYRKSVHYYHICMEFNHLTHRCAQLEEPLPRIILIKCVWRYSFSLFPVSSIECSRHSEEPDALAANLVTLNVPVAPLLNIIRDCYNLFHAPLQHDSVVTDCCTDVHSRMYSLALHYGVYACRHYHSRIRFGI